MLWEWLPDAIDSVGPTSIIVAERKKIRHCFFNVNKSKIANCVSASASTQHIEAPISANNIQLDNQSKFCCQAYFITPGLQFQASLSIAHLYGLSWVF